MKADVIILGQKYTIKGQSSPEHINELAGYIDEMIKDIMEKSPQLTPLNAAILASFNMANEIVTLQEEQRNITRSLEANAERLEEILK